MKMTILNRDFKHPDDGWYQIEAKGEHVNQAAGVIQVIDDEAIKTIVNRFNDDARAGRLRHGNELLVDHEHFSTDLNQESRAYGWLQELQARDDGIYGRIRWTRTGQAAVDGGDYRFFSTEYSPADAKVLNTEGTLKRIRPVRLDGLTLTNMNNNRGQKPITNREDFPPGVVPADEPKRKETMKSVALALGLPADATEDAILQAIDALKSKAVQAETELPKVTNRVQELEKQNQALLTEQVDTLLDVRQVTDEKVRNRLKLVLVPLQNRQEREACLDDFGFKAPAAGAVQTHQRKIYNREGGAPAVEETAEDKALANKILNRARELQKTGMTFNAAFEEATKELVG